MQLAYSVAPTTIAWTHAVVNCDALKDTTKSTSWNSSTGLSDHLNASTTNHQAVVTPQSGNAPRACV